MGLTLVFLFFGLICFLSFSSCSPPTSRSSPSPNILAAFLFGKYVLEMLVLSRCRSRISSWLVKRFEIPHFLGTTDCFWPLSQERSGSGPWRWRHPCNFRQASSLIMLWWNLYEITEIMQVCDPCSTALPWPAANELLELLRLAMYVDVYPLRMHWRVLLSLRL
jgi:hypothetical protein